MAHNVRLNPDSFYRNGVPLPASFYQGVDTAQSKAIAADSGGTWNPSAPIQIAGAGVMFAGPTTTSGGASITTPPGSGKRVVLAANDFVELLIRTSPERADACDVGAGERRACPLGASCVMELRDERGATKPFSTKTSGVPGQAPRRRRSGQAAARSGSACTMWRALRGRRR